MEYENTLLIVESPEIARRIDRLTIPYLTTFSTNGFLWWPKLSSKGDRLTLKATIEQHGVKKRRELKEISSSAVTIICATDHDPAGEFIAWSIEHYLKRSCIHQSLTDLTKSGILELIRGNKDSRTKPEPTILHGLMLLGEIDATLPSDLLNILFQDICQFPEIYRPPVEQTDFISFARSYLTEKCVTLPGLLLAVHHETSASFQKIYEETWNLFLHPEALITYPRTVNRGFYAETWEKQSIISVSPETQLCLSTIRPIAKSGTAHESMRVTNLDILPIETKKWLSKTQRIIYSYIWSQTQSIFYPDLEKIEADWRRGKKNGFSNDNAELSVSAIYETAASYGLIRNSNIYKTLSYLYSDGSSTDVINNSHQEPIQKHFTELYEWLKQPTNHPKKRSELQKISGEILRLKKR